MKQTQDDFLITLTHNHKPDPTQHTRQNQGSQEPRSGLIPACRRCNNRITRITAPAPRRPVPHAGPARSVRNQFRRLRNQIALNDTQRTHLLSQPRVPIISRVVSPVLTARCSIRAAIALCRCCRGGSCEKRENVGGREGGDFCGGGHPAREVGFEGVLVGVAGPDCVDVFAGFFVHDAGGGEEDVGFVEETFGAFAPEGGAVCLFVLFSEKGKEEGEMRT